MLQGDDRINTNEMKVLPERWQNTRTSFLAIILVLFIYYIARRKFHLDFYARMDQVRVYHILGQVVCVGRFKMGLSH